MSEAIATIGTSSAHRARMSWPDALIAGVARLPLPGWLFYLALGALAVAGMATLSVYLGVRMRPEYVVLLGVQVVWPLALAHYLDGIARDALRHFRPVLDVDDAELARIERDLLEVKAGGAFLASAIGVLIGAVTIFSSDDQQFARFLSTRETAPYFVALLGLTGLTWGPLVYRAIRQLRTIVRLNGRAEGIDPLRPGPAHAFSPLTARLALGLMAVVFAWSAVDIEQELANPSSLISGAITILFAVGVFVTPLWGMHRRLVAERTRMLDEASERLEQVTTEVHARARSLDLRDADALNKMVGSLIAERDLLHRTSTWPWETGTLNTFITVLGAPIALFILTRVLERVLR